MINSVRNTVLSVLNKNNYGYISPSDFNLFAKNAQMELYDEYFNNYNKLINSENARMSGVDYADLKKSMSENMENLMRTDFLVPIVSVATLGTKVGGSGYTTGVYYNVIMTAVSGPMYTAPIATITVSGGAVTVVTLTSYGSGVSTSTVLSAPSSLIGGTGSGFSVPVATVTSSSNKYYMPTANTTGSEAYMVNKIICYDPITNARLGEAEKVTNSSITLLIESPLTSPTTKYPAYTLQGETITVYPDTINGRNSLQCSYFSFPLPPKWTYITLFNGEPAFDQSQPDYQDFQLPQQDEYKLVMKILQYCGISIRENEVVQYAIGQEQYEQPTFSQKQ